MPQKTDASARTAMVVLAAEAVGTVALAAWQAMAVLGGDTESLTSAIALIVCTLIAAGALAAFAVGTVRGSSWGRSGGVVCQLLILAVALGTVTGSYAHPLVGAVLAAIGLAGLIPLALASRRAAQEDARRDD